MASADLSLVKDWVSLEITPQLYDQIRALWAYHCDYAIDPEKSLWPPQRSTEIAGRNEKNRSRPSPQSSP